MKSVPDRGFADLFTAGPAGAGTTTVDIAGDRTRRWNMNGRGSGR